MNTKRLERVVQSIKDNNVYQFIVTDPKSIFYLTGINIHPGQRFLGLYINQNKEYHLIVNRLFPIDRNDLSILYYSDTESAIENASKIINKNEVMGVDKSMASRFLIEMIERQTAKNYVNSSACVDYVRMQKDEEEIEKMSKASEINDAVMKDIIDFVHSGIKEIEVVEELKALYKKNGADGGFSFSPIVGFAGNAADPHHATGNTIIGERGCLVIDTGCVHNGYCSDMTRTIFLGEPDEEEKKIYNIVKKANENAIEMVKPGVKFSDVDNAARSY